MNVSWFESVDSYCERLHPGFWAEPVNALSNGFFLLATLAAFRVWRSRGRPDWPALWLIALTAVVGTGSFLFHTLANRWSLLADVLPIAVFIYGYFLLAMRRYLWLGILPAFALTLAFAAFNIGFGRLWSGVFPAVTLNGSVGYLPALMALVGVGLACLVGSARGAGRALLWAGFVFGLSLVFRSIDSAVCSALPLGTHALWHMLNALVLWILVIAALAQGSEEGRPMSRVEIHGYAIVSDDDRIADSTGRTPEVLRNDADWAYFQAELNRSDVTVLGRLGHEANPNPRNRLRVIVSSSSQGIEQRSDGWWWNPEKLPWPQAIRRVLPHGGRVAVPGGRQVFDLFLKLGYDAFHLTRAEGVVVPGGVPVFSGCETGRSAEAILAAAGLRPGPRQVLDPTGPVSLVVWRR